MYRDEAWWNEKDALGGQQQDEDARRHMEVGSRGRECAGSGSARVMGASAEQYYVQNSLGTCKVGGSTGEATARTDDAAKSRRKTTSRSTINPKKRGGQSDHF